MTRLLRRFLPIWVLAAAARAEPLPVVTIQPLGPVKESIPSLHPATVEVPPEKPLDEVRTQEPAHAHRILARTAHGLGHCGVAGCLVQDAKGKIDALDGESGKPCEKMFRPTPAQGMTNCHFLTKTRLLVARIGGFS